MRSEFDTLEQYQESMKEFNENTRMGFEEFIQSHGSDRNKLQLRCTPYTSKKGGYGSFDLDFGLCVYQHQQSKVDEITQLYAKELFNKKVVTKKASEKLAGLQLQNDELQKRVDAVQALAERWKAYKGLDIKQIGLQNCANELEQALKGGGDE